MIHFAVFAQQRSENVHSGQHIICLLKAVEVDWKEACGLASGYWSYKKMFDSQQHVLSSNWTKEMYFHVLPFFSQILYN